MNQPDRRTGADRRAVSGDRTGEIDPILFGRLCVAHADAEEHYLRVVALAGGDDAWSRMLDGANAKAEGLALAVAIISGDGTGAVRERAQQRCEDRRGAR